MKRLSAALGTMLILGSPAFAASSDPNPAAQDQRIAAAPPMPGPDHAKRPDGMGPDMWPPMPPHGQRPWGPELAMRLAARLAAAETLIGIKSDQFDAWRAYTSALIDLLEPPAPPPPGAEAERAFAREEEMARRIKERAAKADTLLQAISALRASLTDAQIEALGRIDLRPRPPMPGAWGGHGRMAGPMMAPPPMDRPDGAPPADGGPGDGLDDAGPAGTAPPPPSP